jgi:amino acid transporter
MGDTDGPNTRGADTLAKNALGTPAIVFFVVAAAAPLAIMNGSAPLSFRLGGIGVPGVYVVCGTVLLFFAIGFTAMSAHVANAGAFYAYIASGLGRPLGVGAALVALYSYSFICIGFFGILGFWMNAATDSLFRWSSPWQLWTYLGIAVIAVLGHRSVEAGARVLTVLLCLEIGVLVVLAIAMLVRAGPDGFTMAGFAPENVFAAQAGGMYVLGFGAFIGFEATAIYAEEARRAERTIPHATYLAIAFLALFYAFVSWAATVGFGVDGLLGISQSKDWAFLMFIAGDELLGGWFSKMMLVFMITSTFAALIAFHNAVARYLFALGREGLLPRALGRTHPKHRSPSLASAAQIALCLVVVTAFVVAGADPYLQLLLWTNGSGIVGIVFCMLLCALAVAGFFAKDRRGHSVFRVVAAPLRRGRPCLWPVPDRCQLRRPHRHHRPHQHLVADPGADPAVARHRPGLSGAQRQSEEVRAHRGNSSDRRVTPTVRRA